MIMGKFVNVKMTGRDKVDARQQARLKNLMADGPMGRKVVGLALTARTKMQHIVHKDTGALWSSIAISKRRYSATNIVAQVYIMPRVKNPRSKRKVETYAPIENARGGSHAFLDRTANEMRNTELVEIRELTRLIVDGVLA